MKKKRKKPTGLIEPIFVKNDRPMLAPNTFMFSDTKEEIEEKLARLFVHLIKKQRYNPFGDKIKLDKNEEYDLDFSLSTKEKNYLLELTEITPQDMKGGFDKLSSEKIEGEHFDKIVSLISKKSDKYRGINGDIILLMYVTDNRSQPAHYTEKLIQNHLNNVKHSFTYVFTLKPILENDGILSMAYPNSCENLTKEQIQFLRNSKIVTFKVVRSSLK